MIITPNLSYTHGPLTDYLTELLELHSQLNDLARADISDMQAVFTDRFTTMLGTQSSLPTISEGKWYLRQQLEEARQIQQETIDAVNEVARDLVFYMLMNPGYDTAECETYRAKIGQFLQMSIEQPELLLEHIAKSVPPREGPQPA